MTPFTKCLDERIHAEYGYPVETIIVVSYRLPHILHICLLGHVPSYFRVRISLREKSAAAFVRIPQIYHGVEPGIPVSYAHNTGQDYHLIVGLANGMMIRNRIVQSLVIPSKRDSSSDSGIPSNPVIIIIRLKGGALRQNSGKACCLSFPDP